jgi:hypothetical protein
MDDRELIAAILTAGMLPTLDVILKIIWRRILNDKWRSVPATMTARVTAGPEQVPPCAQADIPGFDIPPLAWWPSS